MKVKGITLSTQTQFAAVPINKKIDDFVAMVTLTAPMLDDVKRAPVDLVLVVDRSGSMASLMRMVIETIEFIISQLQEKDGLCIVEYDDRINTLIPLTKMTKDGKTYAIEQAKRLSARGGTNLAEGLFEGMRKCANRPEATKNEVASVLLFTDGQANTGVTQADEIVNMMKEGQWKDATISRNVSSSSIGSLPYAQAPVTPQQQRRRPSSAQARSSRSSSGFGSGSFLGNFFGFGSNNNDNANNTPPPPSPPSYQAAQTQQQQQPNPFLPVEGKESEGGEIKKQEEAETPTSTDQGFPFTINTFGFGSSHNEDLLRAIADGGNGLYFYIERKENIADAFIDCVGGLLSVVGQDVNITLQGHGGVELVDVLSKFPKTKTMVDGKSVISLNIKDIQSEETKDIVCTVKLPEVAGPMSQDILHASCKYTNLVASPPIPSKCETLCAVSRVAGDADFKMEANPEVDKQVNRIKVAETLEEVTRSADKGDLQSARMLMRDRIEIMKASPTYNSAEVQEMKERMTETYETLSSKADYQMHGSKAAKCMSMAYAQQRFTGKSAGMYENSRKKKMKSEFALFSSGK